MCTVSRYTRLSAAAQRQSYRPSTLQQILASTTSEGMLADGEKAFMQGDPSVRDEPLYATPPPEGLPGVPERALIRPDREVYGLVSGLSGWRSRIVSQLKEERLRDEYIYIYIYIYMSPVSSPSLPSARNQQSMGNDRTWRVGWLGIARGGRPPDGWPWKGTP